MTKISDDYEIFVQGVMNALTGANVHYKQPYTGVRTGRQIITDVSFALDVAGSKLLFIVECKCYTHKVSVDEVEEFRTKLDDLNAHKGIMVTTVGYQSGALKTAEAYGIALAQITDTQQPNEIYYAAKSAQPESSAFLHGVVWNASYNENPIRFRNGFAFIKMLEDEARQS